MPYLVDGHNLIPKLGLRLETPDDELDLVAHLQEFCRARRTNIEVYFDGAPGGQAPMRKFGAVTAHFIRQGSSADSAIESRLERLGRSARNWMVVSSDHRIQRAAQAVHAQVISSEAFTSMVQKARNELAISGKNAEGTLKPDEVERWLAEFKGRPKV